MKSLKNEHNEGVKEQLTTSPALASDRGSDAVSLYILTKQCKYLTRGESR